ncbi:MAG: response regulator transcription factor [Cyanobacteriota bacterium]|nr:response regulator transcription factor [Cyanobacteriota bacterium]
MANEILLVEDDAEIAELVRLYLAKDGFNCHWIQDGAMAVAAFQDHPVPLIILDLMLPHLDGLEICTQIRQSPGGKAPYILMLTARGEEMDRIIGLSTGADDYIVKPFSPRELVARVRALLRRSLRQTAPVNTLQTCHFWVDLDQRLAKRAGDPLDLTTLEFELLAVLMRHPGRVWTRSQLIDRLWGHDFFGDERVVDTHVARLRKKIEWDPSQPSFIKTVIGVGYKFEDEEGDRSGS